MSCEWGLFNSEGCVEAGFYTHEDAVQTAADSYDTEDELYIAVICPQHPEEEKDSCELCNAEEE